MVKASVKLRQNMFFPFFPSSSIFTTEQPMQHFIWAIILSTIMHILKLFYLCPVGWDEKTIPPYCAESFIQQFKIIPPYCPASLMRQFEITPPYSPAILYRTLKSAHPTVQRTGQQGGARTERDGIIPPYCPAHIIQQFKIIPLYICVGLKCVVQG